MDANFFYYSIYDRFMTDARVRACVCAFVNFLFKKLQKLLTGLLPNFIVVFLR